MAESGDLRNILETQWSKPDSGTRPDVQKVNSFRPTWCNNQADSIVGGRIPGFQDEAGTTRANRHHIRP